MNNLVAFSRHYGADPALVVAGGGNTSIKENGILYVKGSGTALASVSPEDFVALDIAKLLGILDKQYPADDAQREAAFLADILAARLPGNENKRPSVETLLHALFPQRYVLHLHPAMVNGLTCSQQGRQASQRLFPKAAWLDECRPGYTMAVLLADEVARGVDTVLLQNHGVFFAAETPEQLETMLDDMLNTLRAEIVRAHNPEHKTEASLSHPFTPDHLVYCGLGPNLPENESASLLWEDAKKIAEYAASFGGARPMSDDLRDFIKNWEAESYRRKQA